MSPVAELPVRVAKTGCLRAEPPAGRHIWLVAIVAAITLSGCGAAASPSSNRPPAPHQPQIEALVAHKVALGHAARRRHEPTAGYTYPSMGVNVQRPAAGAAKQAARAGVPTAAAALAALSQDPVAYDAFASAPAGGPLAKLETITERYPTTRRVHVGVPYTAWVLTGRGSLPDTGGGYNRSATATVTTRSSPPATNSCQVVAIYSLPLRRWTETFGSCSTR